MIFDESNGRLTTELCGRTVEYVTRQGLELTLHMTGGHEVVLAADVDFNIQHKKTDVKIQIIGMESNPIQGVL